MSDTEKPLTEVLRVAGTELHNLKVDLKAINSKLEIAYKYEDELLQRLVYARQQTQEMRNNFFKKTGEISGKLNEMKKIMDVYTGNFYKTLP